MADGSLDFPIPAGRAATAAILPPPEQLFARCARRVGRHVARALGADDDADDLVQDVLITIFTKLGTLRDPALFDAWVACITTNKIRQAIRQRSRKRRVLGTWHAVQDDTYRTDFDGRVVASRAMSVLDSLSPDERALLIAHWFAAGSADHIAERRGYSISTLQRRIRRAQARFEKLARRDASLAKCFVPKARSR